MAHAAYPVRTNWLSRAIISGFVASIVMLITLVVGFGLASLLAAIPITERPGLRADVLAEWFRNLTDNVLVNVAAPNLYAAIAIHIGIGLTFAAIYAYWFEPRLGGTSWRRGMVFALIPWVLSVVVFFPLVGAGFLGFGLGAGPLPMIGNLILHLVYGATLGLLFGPVGDLSTEEALESPHGPEDVAAMQSSERMAARGILAGLVLGGVVGGIGAIATQLVPEATILGMHPLLFVVGTALFGAAFGGLIGSFVGLPSPGELQPTSAERRKGA